jgi:hypothetical protein
MSKHRREKYRRWLNTPAWKTLRASILARDNYTCQHRGCSETTNLHVHHKHYRWNPKQWGTEPHDWLVTLCEKHHKQRHRRKKQ